MGLKQGIGGIILLLLGIGLLAFAVFGYLDHSIDNGLALGLGISGIVAIAMSIILFVYNK